MNDEEKEQKIAHIKRNDWVNPAGEQEKTGFAIHDNRVEPEPGFDHAFTVPAEGGAVETKVKNTRLIKWDNKPDGSPDYNRGPTEIIEQFGEDDVPTTVYKRRF